MLIVPDTHIPYHDKRAWELMLKVGKAWKPHTIVHIGDLEDFYSVSSHSKDPSRSLHLKEEIDEVKKGLDDLDALKAKRKVLVAGNHFDRLKRYLQDKAPELYTLIDQNQLYDLDTRGWEFVPYKESIKIGKVYFTHDTGQSGKYTTARALETFQHSVVIGHHHVIQMFVEGDATGRHRVGVQFGWLGDIKKVDYMHKVKAKRNWSLGFGIGYHDTESGMIFFQPCPIINYQVCVEGKVYKN